MPSPVQVDNLSSTEQGEEVKPVSARARSSRSTRSSTAGPSAFCSGADRMSSARRTLGFPPYESPPDSPAETGIREADSHCEWLRSRQGGMFQPHPSLDSRDELLGLSESLSGLSV